MKDKIYFHGTEYSFNKFLNDKTFFTDCSEIAGLFSLKGSVSEEDARPNIHPCYLELGKTLELSEDFMNEMFGEPSIRDWTSFDEYTYVIEKQGYDSIFLNSVVDYAGPELGLKPYNQWVVFRNEQIKSIFI